MSRSLTPSSVPSQGGADDLLHRLLAIAVDIEDAIDRTMEEPDAQLGDYDDLVRSAEKIRGAITVLEDGENGAAAVLSDANTLLGNIG